MKEIWTPKLTEILPDSVLNDPKLRASAEALDLELEKLSLSTREVLHLPRLDELSGRILDFLAEQFHIDFWEPLYLTDDEKKNLIRRSIAWHRIKGTAAAVEGIANAAFRDAQVTEWFDYGGRPYHFYITTHGFKSTPDGFATFLRMLWLSKNVRSWCDKIVIDYPTDEINLYYGTVPVETGHKRAEIARPRHARINLHAGAALYETGLHGGADIAKPRSDKVKLRAGQVLMKSGRIIALPDEDDFRPREHFMESAIADVLIVDVGIARPNDVPNQPEPINPEIFAVPDGEWLRVYMDFATGRDKPILLKNPREDLLTGDVKSVGDFAVENDIFLNQHAENTLGIRRADLIRVFSITNADDVAQLPDSGMLRLFFKFPQGNMRKILLHNPRSGITIGEIKSLGKQAASAKLLLNARGQATEGISHAAVVKRFFIGTDNQPVSF